MLATRRGPVRSLALIGSAALLGTGLAVAAPAAATSSASLPVSNCGGHTPAKVSRVTVEPSPLVAGRNADLTLRGTLSKAVSGGTYDVRITYFGAPLFHTDGDLADVVQLPLPAGTFSLHKRVKVPNQAPSGKYNLTLTAADHHNDQLLCVRVPFSVR